MRDIPKITQEKSREILERSQMDAWAACAAIWSRVYVLSGPGWERRPVFRELISRSYSVAIQRATGSSTFLPDASLVKDMESFDVEDDGSAAWNYMIDVMEMISAAIGGKDIDTCLKTAIRVYLEVSFNLRTRDFALEQGRPISYADTKARMANDPVWIRSLNFVDSLLYCAVYQRSQEAEFGSAACAALRPG